MTLSRFIHAVAGIITPSVLRLSIIPCLYILRVVGPFIRAWTLGRFHLLAVVNRAAMNILKHMTCCIYVGISPVKRRGILGKKIL